MTTPVQQNLFNNGIAPEYVVAVSWGNDSVALVQWLHEKFQKHAPDGGVYCVYSDTGWASSWWPARVEKAEKWAQGLGFKTDRGSYSRVRSASGGIRPAFNVAGMGRKFG